MSTPAESGRAHAGAREACWAILLAAGSGERLGAGEPKAFVTHAGHPLVYWSLRTFARHADVTDILLVLPPQSDAARIAQQRAALAGSLGEPASKIRAAIPGGERRQDSAYLALCAARELGAPDDALVLLHDAARPDVSAALVGEVVARLRAARGAGALAAEPLGVIPVLPVDETLKAIDETSAVTGTLPRAGLVLAQTPQGFTLGPLLAAHARAREAAFAATDDAMLYEWQGWRVETIPGSPANIKVTYRNDLARLARRVTECEG
jgi:2-C-methyl-D-erythritol 4-phosphate cytidylyltransferase